MSSGLPRAALPALLQHSVCHGTPSVSRLGRTARVGAILRSTFVTDAVSLRGARAPLARSPGGNPAPPRGGNARFPPGQCPSPFLVGRLRRPAPRAAPRPPGCGGAPLAQPDGPQAGDGFWRGARAPLARSPAGNPAPVQGATVRRPSPAARSPALPLAPDPAPGPSRPAPRPWSGWAPGAAPRRSESRPAGHRHRPQAPRPRRGS